MPPTSEDRSPAEVRDLLDRPLRDLRVSVTDRCNLRCRYCMPREHFGPGAAFLPRSEILSFEEIAEVVEAGLPLGLRKVRITGGEPLLRRELPELIRQLRRFPVELALTTNGHRLSTLASQLAQAGLHRVSVSLDALEPGLYSRITDSPSSVDQVLAGIDAAEAAGLTPVKINAVVRRGCNEAQALPLVERFLGRKATVRFIEFMDVGATNGWDPNAVVTGAEIRRAIEKRFVLEPVSGEPVGAVAERWRIAGTDQEVGFINSVTRPFCRGCTRLRLSANGRVHRCLFASEGFDLRAVLRSPRRPGMLTETLAALWRGRGDRYSELRARGAAPTGRPEMSYLGG